MKKFGYLVQAVGRVPATPLRLRIEGRSPVRGEWIEHRSERFAESVREAFEVRDAYRMQPGILYVLIEAQTTFGLTYRYAWGAEYSQTLPLPE